MATATEDDPKKGARRAMIASGLAFVATGGFAPLPVTARVAFFVLGLVALAAAVAARKKRAAESDTTIAIQDEAIVRTTPEGTKSLARWDEPFGVSLLASYGRPRAVLAFTTSTQTRYVPVHMTGRIESDEELFARIAVLADLDLVDGVAHDAALGASACAELLREIEARSERALGRFFLSDGEGTPISLDQRSLRAAGNEFDLLSGLEWRPLMFHESTGQAAALYQATWIRQGTAEVVLVAPMPASIVPRDASAQAALGRLGRALTRDIKLLQAPAESPPSRDLRVAIDRPFMMAVRRALDEAPLAVRLGAETAPTRPRKESSSSL